MVMGELTEETELLVIGGGPGGYAAAFRAADLGMDVTMVDMESRPGGECLFRGCIPSKTLLYLSELLHDAERAESMGIAFSKPKIDLDTLRAWKDKVIDTLADGLVTLSKKRGVQFIRGQAVFEGSDKVRLQKSEVSHIKFRHAILATGSESAPFPGIDFTKGSRVMDSTGALDLEDVPESILILGGGYVALEMGTVYASLGSQVTVAVRSERLLRGADSDLVEPLIRRLRETFKDIRFNKKASALKEKKNGVEVTWEGDKGKETFGRVLVAIGRRPRSKGIGLEATKVKLNDKGYVVVDEQQRTSDERIFAIGDVAGGPLLAHKAFREGKVAAEVIAGEPSAFDARAIPAIVFTDPQIAWCGLTEEGARKQDRTIKVERFPWKFSGRAVSMGVTEGVTKMIINPESQRILGLGVAGRNAECLIAEGVLAVEMGALTQDVALSIHTHPTLSETVGEVADMFLGSPTHILAKKKRD